MGGEPQRKHGRSGGGYGSRGLAAASAAPSAAGCRRRAAPSGDRRPAAPAAGGGCRGERAGGGSSGGAPVVRRAALPLEAPLRRVVRPHGAGLGAHDEDGMLQPLRGLGLAAGRLREGGSGACRLGRGSGERARPRPRAADRAARRKCGGGGPARARVRRARACSQARQVWRVARWPLPASARFPLAAGCLPLATVQRSRPVTAVRNDAARQRGWRAIGAAAAAAGGCLLPRRRVCAATAPRRTRVERAQAAIGGGDGKQVATWVEGAQHPGRRLLHGGRAARTRRGRPQANRARCPPGGRLLHETRKRACERGRRRKS